MHADRWLRGVHEEFTALLRSRHEVSGNGAVEPADAECDESDEPPKLKRIPIGALLHEMKLVGQALEHAVTRGVHADRWLRGVHEEFTALLRSRHEVSGNGLPLSGKRPPK